MQVDPMSKHIADVTGEYLDRVNAAEMEYALLDEPVERQELRARLNDTTKAALAALKQKALADHEKAKASERAKARLEQMAFLKQEGLEYLDAAGSLKDPLAKLAAAKAGLSRFVQMKPLTAVRQEVDSLIARAQEVVAAAEADIALEAEYVFVNA